MLHTYTIQVSTATWSLSFTIIRIHLLLSISILSKFSSPNNNILNTNLIIKNNELDYTYFELVGTILEGYDETAIAKKHYDNIQLNTCYNKFLSYNHLPLLSHPQTIRSFLHYIYSFDYSPDNCCGYTLTISIKNDYSEAHVYLPHEPKPLPNHFIIPVRAIWHYPNIQLKSNTSTPVFSILAPLDHHFFSNSNQPDNNSNQIQDLNLTVTTHNARETNQYIPNLSHIPQTKSKPLNLSICTHNVRGYNEDLKQQVWEDFCLANNLKIISITETKIAANNPITKLQKSKHFTYLWSCTDNPKAGTAIMIHKSIKCHIHKILLSSGYAIAVDLFFKHDFKFRIISIYLSNFSSFLYLFDLFPG